MEKTTQQVQQAVESLETYDLIIIGANIIGSGIAREAALRGLKVVIINMEDFASGCNSNPGELVYGVERYLENSHLSLTWTSAQERRILKKIAPQLVKNLPFIIPEQIGDKRLKVGKEIGFAVYDFFAGFDKLEKPIQLNSEQLSQKLPGVDIQKYPEGVVFYDCNVNDYRLTITNVLDSVSNHATHLNYWYVDKIEKFLDKIKVFAQDLITGKTKQFVAPTVINTTGPFANANLQKWGFPEEPQQKIIKSAHFFIPTISPQFGIVLNAKEQKRIVYALPLSNCTLVGLTDIDVIDSLACPNIKKSEIEFALGQINQLLPKQKLSIKDVFAPMAAIKAFLPNHQHKIVHSQLGKGNLISVFGGKLTVYRKIAEEVVDKVVKLTGKKYPSSSSSTSRLKGSQFNETSFKSFLEHRLISYFQLQKLPIDVSMNILKLYGTQVDNFNFLPYLDKPDATKRILPGTSNIWAQFYYSIDYEFVRKPSDFAVRRTNLFLDLIRNPEFILKYFQKAGKILKLKPAQIEEDHQHFLDSFKIVD